MCSEPPRSGLNPPTRLQEATYHFLYRCPTFFRPNVVKTCTLTPTDQSIHTHKNVHRLPAGWWTDITHHQLSRFCTQNLLTRLQEVTYHLLYRCLAGQLAPPKLGVDKICFASVARQATAQPLIGRLGQPIWVRQKPVRWLLAWLAGWPTRKQPVFLLGSGRSTFGAEPPPRK